MKPDRIGFRAFFLGTLFAAAFAWYAVRAENFPPRTILTATQIPVLPYLLLIFLVAIVNPLLRFVKVSRGLAKSEIMLIFVMGMVSAGLASFGLASQVVPLVAGLFNRDWNTRQARWDLYIEPYVNESFFISEPGIRSAAEVSRDAEFAWRRAVDQLRAAEALEQARAELASVAAAVDREPTSRGLQHRKALAETVMRELETRWEKASEGVLPDTVIASYPGKIEGLKVIMDERRESLRVLEERAFAKTDAFRRGLPADMRAIPGLFAQENEVFEVYLARLSLMRRGMSALRELRKIEESLPAQGDGAPPATAAESLRKAVATLQPEDRTTELQARRHALQEDRRVAESRLGEARRLRDKLAAERRDADASEFHRIDTVLESGKKTIQDMEQDIQRLDDDLSHRVTPRMALAASALNVVTQLQALAVSLAWSGTTAPANADAFRVSLHTVMDQFAPLGISWRQFFLGDVPWGLWVTPLLLWSGVVLVTYLMLMTLNVLIFRQWAHHERLIYPLAELPLLLGGFDTEGSDLGNNAVPPLYRSSMFWLGVAVSVGVLGWNLLAAKSIIPGVKQIPLVFPWDDYVKGSMFSGLSPNTQHQIFFTLIGIAFLIPARISYSMWSFHVIYMLLALALIGLGHGVNLRSFPHDMKMVFNFRNAMGGGAMVAFSSVILWKCRKYLVCAFRPDALGSMDAAERAELRVSSFVFLGSSLALILLLTFGLGSNLFFSIFCWLFMLLVTIGMVRAIAEGGLFCFQCWFNPFHVIRSVFGMNRAWTSASVLAPLAVFYYVILWDIKTYIAPAMANALKIRDRLGIGRLKFHAAVFTGIAVASGVAIATHIIFAYHKGGDAMHAWFYKAALNDYLFGWIKTMAISNPVDTAGGRYWFLAGILVMAFLIFFRRKCFWLPHPLGMIVWVNPVMWCFWFSFFLGWAFKTLVSRYGNRDTYYFFRAFFIGLIVGELVMCLFGVDLNRNWG
ncbi:MAG: hypothetical protein FJ222_08510 [Lentisphaerae bacterium]|nr:hypothetical protein [Lentisphaerota bacterium]